MSTPTDLQVGVVGTGFIGPAHVEALRRLGITVACIVGSSPGRAQPKADAMRLGRVYSTFEEMLADPQIGVVHITSPNHLHYPQPANMSSVKNRWPWTPKSPPSCWRWRKRPNAFMPSTLTFASTRLPITPVHWCRAGKSAMFTLFRVLTCKIGSSSPPTGTGAWNQG